MNIEHSRLVGYYYLPRPLCVSADLYGTAGATRIAGHPCSVHLGTRPSGGGDIGPPEVEGVGTELIEALVDAERNALDTEDTWGGPWGMDPSGDRWAVCGVLLDFGVVELQEQERSPSPDINSDWWQVGGPCDSSVTGMIRNLIDGWFAYVQSWAGIFSHQQFRVDYRIPKAANANLALGVVEARAAHISRRPPRVNISVGERWGEALDASAWRDVLDRAGRELIPTPVLGLIGDARAAFFDGDYRVAVIECGSAIELSLVAMLKEQLSPLPEPNLREAIEGKLRSMSALKAVLKV